MKNLFTTLAILLVTTFAMAQGTITGKIVDVESEEPLIGASAILKGTLKGTVTDFDGSFTLSNIENGDYTVVVTYTGYAETERTITVKDNTVELGIIEMDFDAVGLKQVEVIASVAVDRKTPIAVSTLKAEVIEAKVGNQEFPEILKRTPSIYATKQGGGFGDARINVRGFDQVNTAVMINGIPVNDMENGRVFWSNWAGLSEVSSSIQVQRGLGASKLAVPSVGGSINIITKAADMQKKAVASVSIGNDGYQKYGVALSSGLLENGWAFTGQGTYTKGDGYVDGTAFEAWSYFASISNTINDKHTLSLSAVGAPQIHNQRNAASRFDNITLRTFVGDENTEGRGIRFNHTWGTLDGEEFNFRQNFYHKPKVFLNHYWTLNEKTDIKTSAYVSFGRGGGTGPRGRIRNPGSLFDSFGGFGKGLHNEEGQIQFDEIVKYNSGQESIFGVKDPLDDGSYIVTSDGKDGGSGFIRRASMNTHNWYGVLSTLSHELTDNLTLVAGIDGRYYKGEHFRRLENLLGADGYLSRSDDNNPTNLITQPVGVSFSTFSDDSYKDGNNVLNYHNDGLVSWLGGFAQLEYSNDRLTAFGSVALSNQGFKRIDYFNYLDSDPARETDWQNFLGGIVKGGANLNISESSNVFVNAGYISRQPLFDNVFLNFVNDINENAQNQEIVSFEAGYGFRSKVFDAKVNVYHTNWGNRQFDRSFNNFEYVFNGDSLVVDAVANFSGVNQLHQGAEVEFSLKPSRIFTLDGALGLGNWRYTDNFTAQLIDTDNSRTIDNVTIFSEEIKIGDAAQTTLSLGATVYPVDGLSIYVDGFYYNNLYADFDLLDDQFFSPGAQVVKLPDYFLTDLGASYNFDLAGFNVTARVNINNLFDTQYVSELETNIVDDPSTATNEFLDNRGFYGFGRTWNAGLKFRF